MVSILQITTSGFKKLWYLVFAAWCLVFVFGLSAYAMGRRPVYEPRYIRVEIIRNAASLDLTLRGSYQIKTLDTDESLIEGKNLKNVKVFPASDGIAFEALPVRVYGVRIETRKQGAIYLNNRRFRGNIALIKNSDQTLLVVNEIDVEDYLYGVLRGEVPYRWPLEVLKAQAVCARTFALYQDSINADKDYSLTSDVYSQVYGGKSIERFWTNRAVNKTLGEVLTYQGRIFPAYYHSTCGGHTENSAFVWNIDLPPLKGVKDPFCKHSPHFHWKRTIGLNEIRGKLSKAKYEVGRIKNLIVDERNLSGRIRNIEVIGAKASVSIPANKFRHLIGINLIKSTNFSIKIAGKKAVFSGTGWGHGIGLCQWGAYFMARKGYDYKEILSHYYPGAEIKNIYH
ncbi:MAG: SpoIID/LytB domain-containing protein [Candidatus Omnitrophota bacterium]|nr:SpoIID/LytB domain-containing protein [Candidatus Omnitrophota bacterium]